MLLVYLHSGIKHMECILGQEKASRLVVIENAHDQLSMLLHTKITPSFDKSELSTPSIFQWRDSRMVFKQLYKVNCCIPHLRPWVPREGLANEWFTLAQPSKIMQYKHRKHHHNSNSDLICITMSGWIYMAGMVRILRADSATFQASQLQNSPEVLFWGMCKNLKELKCYL